MTWRSFHRWRRGIGPRLLVRVLLFSSAITLLLTSFQLYFEYRYAVRAIEGRMSEIEGSYLQSLGGSLWNLDSRQIELQIEGILRLPAIRFVEVRETTDRANPLVVSGGHRQEHAALRRVFPLVHTSHGDQEQLGVLSIEATFDEVYRALLQKAIIILISEGAQIFLVSFFILSLTHRLVTRHLTALAGFLGTYDVRQPPPPLRLQRRAPKDKDELDHVLAAFERMRESLERAYEALQESEQRFRDYAETASDWFWATGLDHAFTYFSEQPSFCRDWGTLIGKCRWDVAADVASEPEHWRQHMATLERREPFRDFVYKVRYGDGTLGFVSISGKPVWDAEGRFAGYRGVARDITERQRAEEALRRSELYLVEGQRLAHMGSWAFNTAGFDYWSPELFRIYGLDPSRKAPTVEEYMGLVHPEDRGFVAETIQKVFAEGRGFDFTKRIVRPDGEIRSVRCVGVPSTHGTSEGFVGTGIDVTEQERILDELKRSEFYLSEGQRLGHAGSWSINPSGFFDYWSRELFQIYGLDPERKAPTIQEYLASVHPQDREFMARTIERMLAEGLGCDVKKRIVRPDGKVRYVRCVGIPIVENGFLKRIVGTAMDITEQEELTQELRRREAYLAEAQRLSHTGSFGWNYGATGELTWSEETYRICGFDSSIKPTHELVGDRVHPDDLHVWQQAFDRAAEGKEVDFEHRLLMPDGSVKHLHVVAYGVQKDGKFVELIGSVRDITEQKSAERAVRRSEAYLAEAQRLSHTGSSAYDPATGKIHYWSEETYRIWGLDPQQPLPDISMIVKMIHPEDRDLALEQHFNAVREGKDYDKEFRIVQSGGAVRHVHVVGHPVFSGGGELIDYFSTHMDITERKRAEEAIRRSEAFLAEGQRLSHTGSWGWNASTEKVTWSQEHFRILGLDPQNTNPSLEVFWERVHPDDRIALRRTFESAIRDKRDFEQEFRIVTPDWSIRHLHGVGHAILNEANELVEFIGSAMDITERKRAEERVQSQREAILLALNAFVEKLDVNRFLGDIIAEFNKQFHAKSWELWLLDDSCSSLLLHSSSHASECVGPAIGSRNARPLEELQGLWPIKDVARAPQILELSSQESLLSRRHGESLTGRGIKTLMIVPLVLGEQNLGFLELHFQSQTQFSSDDLELAQALVNHATLALQLNRLTRRAEQLAVTEERNRLAREIHDTLAQAFAGVVLHSEVLGASLAVSKRRSAKALTQIQKLARSGLEEARRSVQALRPKALDDTPLPEALEQAALRLCEDAKLSCQFRQRGKTINLSSEIQNELFRISQEALTNVVKHAQARSVCITLNSQARRVSLSIEDDGIGLATAEPPDQRHGFGMRTMRERAQGIGGRLRVESRPGRGTTIRVEVPSAVNRSKKKVNQ